MVLIVIYPKQIINLSPATILKSRPKRAPSTKSLYTMNPEIPQDRL